MALYEPFRDNSRMANWQNRVEITKPSADEGMLRRHAALVAAGDAAGALALATEAVQRGSKRMTMHLRLVSGLQKAGRYREADFALDKAARSTVPDSPAQLVELIRRLAYFNRSSTMRGIAIRLLNAKPWQPAAEADVAAMLSMVGEQALAFSLLRRAMASLGPAPGPLYNRSQMHLYSGRISESEADLRSCLRMEPGNAKAHWALSKIPSVIPTEAELREMTKLASSLPAGSQDEVFMRFALFNSLDRMGRTEPAWAQLQRGCEAKRALLDYDPAASRQLFEALRSFEPGSAPVATPGVAGPTPVFIVGMHRSGTTLLERVLGNHSRIAAGGELYDFPAQLRWGLDRHFAGPTDARLVADAEHIDFDAVGRRYLDQVHWRSAGKDFLIDKLPSNFLNIGFIRRALPQARVLHMTRDAMDTGFSNLKELFSSACPYSYRQDELADWYCHYRELMAHWHRSAPGWVLDVSYERLAADPQTELRRVLAFCGLEFEPACLDVGSPGGTVNTASSAQVREPIHQRGIEAWRRYEDRLGPLAARLGGDAGV
jgi:hypothetical protein